MTRSGLGGISGRYSTGRKEGECLHCYAGYVWVEAPWCKSRLWGEMGRDREMGGWNKRSPDHPSPSPTLLINTYSQEILTLPEV